MGRWPPKTAFHKYLTEYTKLVIRAPQDDATLFPVLQGLLKEHERWKLDGDAGVAGMSYAPERSWLTLAVVVQAPTHVDQTDVVRLVVSALVDGCKGMPLNLPLRVARTEIPSETMRVGALVAIINPTFADLDSGDGARERTLSIAHASQLVRVAEARELLLQCSHIQEDRRCVRFVHISGAKHCPTHTKRKRPTQPKKLPSPPPTPTPTPTSPRQRRGSASRCADDAPGSEDVEEDADSVLADAWAAIQHNAKERAVMRVQRGYCNKCSQFVAAGTRATCATHSTCKLVNKLADKRVYMCTRCRVVTVCYTISNKTESARRPGPVGACSCPTGTQQIQLNASENEHTIGARAAEWYSESASIWRRDK